MHKSCYKPSVFKYRCAKIQFLVKMIYICLIWTCKVKADVVEVLGWYLSKITQLITWLRFYTTVH